MPAEMGGGTVEGSGVFWLGMSTSVGELESSSAKMTLKNGFSPKPSLMRSTYEEKCHVISY